MKRIITALLAIFSVLFIALLTCYISNENAIKKEKKNSLGVLGFLEPYISHYNDGNVYYTKEEYHKAIEEYEEALKKHPTKERECKIRINLALAMVMPIDEKSINEDNVDDIIEILEGAVATLCEKGCAHRNDEDGHNKDAQQLKDDIEKFIEKLKQNNSPEPSSEDESTEESTEEETTSGDETTAETEEVTSEGPTTEDPLIPIQQGLHGGQQEHINGMQNTITGEYNFGNDPCW